MIGWRLGPGRAGSCGVQVPPVGSHADLGGIYEKRVEADGGGIAPGGTPAPHRVGSCRDEHHPGRRMNAPSTPHDPPDDGHAGRSCHPRDLPRGHAALAGRPGEGADERPRGARPVRGRLRETGCDRALERHRKRGAHGANRTRRVVDHACGDRLRAGSGKRRLTGQHFVQHSRQGVHVTARVDPLVAARLLRAHVGCGAHRDTGAGQRRSFRASSLLHQLRDPEVGHQGVTAGQEDVLRLDIAMDHAVFVRVLQRVADLGRDADGVVDREWSVATEPLPQRLSFHVFHYIEQQPVCLVGLEQWHDMGMRELRGQQDFPLEPVAPEVGARSGRQQLDRDAAPELHVGAQVHRRHTAPAQLAHQGVATREGASQAVEQRIGDHGRV